MIAEEISKLKLKMKEQEKTFYSSEPYIQKNNDFKNIKEELNLITKVRHKKHIVIIHKRITELKEKIKIESKEVKTRKNFLSKRLNILIKELIAIRPTDLANFSKKMLLK